MQFRPAALRAHLAARKPFAVHYLMWITARNRQTGAEVGVKVNQMPRLVAH